MNLKPYPEYKYSGALRLGMVPNHWEVYPGMALLKEKQIYCCGTTRAFLERIVNLSIPLPPIHEQMQISERIQNNIKILTLL
jgi:hypothetical protein